MALLVAPERKITPPPELHTRDYWLENGMPNYHLDFLPAELSYMWYHEECTYHDFIISINTSVKVKPNRKKYPPR